MTLPSSPDTTEINESVLQVNSRTEDYSDADESKEAKELQAIPNDSYPVQIVWRHVLNFTFFHVTALYGAYLLFTAAKWQTILFTFFMDAATMIGIMAGVHRLWAHRCYKARLPLRIVLSIFYSTAFQLDIVHWVRDHRVHHTYSETVADPHNATRGFFFSHIGWLLSKRHPESLKKLRSVDISDLMADPVVRFNKKYYVLHAGVFGFILPTIIPAYFWGEAYLTAYFLNMFRYVLSLHQTFLVNSAAHLWGSRPYDVKINPRENSFVSISAFGEGFHNYHHTFPFDYSASEYGIKYNVATLFINVMAWLGLAYDRKTASNSMIQARIKRTGEQSLQMLGNEVVTNKDD